MEIHLEAQAHRSAYTLANNPYPGRIIGIVRNEKGDFIQILAITARSEHNQNRVLSQDSARVFTEAADPSRVKDSSNIMYNGMRENGRIFVVTNGNHTDSIIESSEHDDEYFYRSLCGRKYENDPPTFTSRIAGVLDLREQPLISMAILRKSPGSDACERCFYRFEHIPEGFGYFLMTYQGVGGALLPFQGEPDLLRLDGDVDAIADRFWKLLNPANRVSLVVKGIHVSTDGLSVERTVKIKNRFSKVESV